MKLNRRDFLLLSGTSLLAGSLNVQAKPKRRVIIAGAGLAGLSAAYELSLRGYQVTILEGRDRVGGRIFTLKEPFVDGQFVELGGELAGDGYKRFLAYADKFKVRYETFEQEFETGGAVSNLQGGIGTTAFLKDKLYPIGSVLEPHPYSLSGDEAKMLPPALLSRFMRTIIRENAGDAAKFAALDNLSLADVLRKRGASEAAIRLMNLSLNYDSIERVSAGGVLFEMQRRMSAGTRANRIEGGNSTLIGALAANAKKKGTKIILQAKVKSISHSANSVKVSFLNQAGKLQTLTAEKFVSTIPFSVLRDVSFSPALPEAKAKAINELTYTAMTKVYMQGSRFEWDSRNIGSSIWTDTPLERIFSMSGKRGDERGIFAAWMDGDGASNADKLSDSDRQTWAKSEFEKILPFMRGAIERTQTKSWANDEFARGAFAAFSKGQFVSLKPHLKTSSGAIHFAGEHTAELSPGMEAALESAERVVREIDG